MSNFEKNSTRDDNISSEYQNENYATNKKILKDNPYQTKNISSDNKDFFIIKKEHYFNNEYAKRNIIVVLSICIVVFAVLFFVYFGNDENSLKSNYSVYQETSKKTEQTDITDNIKFKDSNLKKLVIETLKLESNEISKEDALKLKSIEIVKENNTKSIKDLENFKNLKSISIKKQVDDIETLENFEEIKLYIENVNYPDIPIFDNIFNIENFEGTITYSKDIENTGKFKFYDGSYYEGTFSNGTIKGKGVYTYSNNGVIEGNFNDIDFSGKSKLYYNNKNLLFDGLFDGKYTTKSLTENYFDSELSGTFYDFKNNKIFVGKYIGKNTLVDNYFKGELDGTFTGGNVIIKGNIEGTLIADYTGDFSYKLNGTLSKNSSKIIEGNFDIVVKNGKEISCKGTGVVTLPEDFNTNGLILDGEIEYNTEENHFSVVGESYRIINNTKIYEFATSNTIESYLPTQSNDNKWWH